jgi:hypothetical protein
VLSTCFIGVRDNDHTLASEELTVLGLPSPRTVGVGGCGEPQPLRAEYVALTLYHQHRRCSKYLGQTEEDSPHPLKIPYPAPRLTGPTLLEFLAWKPQNLEEQVAILVNVGVDSFRLSARFPALCQTMFAQPLSNTSLV